MPIISVYSIKIVRSCLLDIPPHIAQFSNTTVHFLRLKKLYWPKTMQRFLFLGPLWFRFLYNAPLRNVGNDKFIAGA